MNCINIVGRLTKQPETRGNDNNICIFTVAVNRNYTNQNGEREADFIQVKTFKKLAENCSKYLGKGSLVSVEASLRTGSFEKDGKKIFTMEVIADDVRFLDSKGNKGNNQDSRNNNNQFGDEPPFGENDYNDFNPSGDDWPF